MSQSILPAAAGINRVPLNLASLARRARENARGHRHPHVVFGSDLPTAPLNCPPGSRTYVHRAGTEHAFDYTPDVELALDDVILTLFTPTTGTLAAAAPLTGVLVLPFWLRGGKTVILPGFGPVEPSLDSSITEHRATAINLGADDDSDATRTP
ncbi:unnamed protein product, partial [Mesorhabditis spiculigera]